jgi:hypothetical protein
VERAKAPQRAQSAPPSHVPTLAPDTLEPSFFDMLVAVSLVLQTGLAGGAASSPMGAPMGGAAPPPQKSAGGVRELPPGSPRQLREGSPACCVGLGQVGFAQVASWSCHADSCIHCPPRTGPRGLASAPVGVGMKRASPRPLRKANCVGSAGQLRRRGGGRSGCGHRQLSENGNPDGACRFKCAAPASAQAYPTPTFGCVLAYFLALAPAPPGPPPSASASPRGTLFCPMRQSSR